MSVGSRVEHVSAKCDFALAMVDKDGYGDMKLCQMADAYTSTLCLPCPIVVKRHGGNAEEVELQLMIWLASALAHMEYLRGLAREPKRPVPPVVGWTVIGHTWSFYIAWSFRSDVTVMGLYNPGNAGTTDVLSIYVLTSLWKRLFEWIQEVYYPAYNELLQGAIDALEDDRTPGPLPAEDKD